jgi:uncharacterized protein
MHTGYSAVWETLDEPGLEYASVDETAGWNVDSHAVALVDGSAIRVAYQLQTGPEGGVRLLDIAFGEHRQALRGNGAGVWSMAAGDPRPDLDGCVDVDISITPLTNTLPIRRCQLAVGDRADLSVVYVDIASGEVRPMQQRYTRLADRRYRYESSGFAAELEVDEHGLVIDYPPFWRRLR